MPDMLVKLYDLPGEEAVYSALTDKEVKLKRAFGGDKGTILQFIRENFSDGWAHESERAILALPSTCYIAVKNKEVVGFACYDATAKGFFGPLGVKESERKSGIGRALTLKAMLAMREAGYGYAIIGWVGPVAFYEKTVGATVIENSSPGVYIDMIKK